MYIVGLNSFHGDSSACLLKDGVLIAAAEEERFRRIKHWAGFPSEAMKWCLTKGGISLEDVEHIAVNQDPKANFYKKIMYIIKNPPKLDMLYSRFRNRIERGKLSNYLLKEFPGQLFKGKIHNVEHHTAHLSSAFHVSPFDQAAVLSVDGFGDFASTAWGIGSGTEIDIKERVYFPHSLGIYYMALTQFIGFNNWGDEYKVMGLAPYGRPKYLNEIREIINLKTDGKFELNLDYFCHHKEKIEYIWKNDSPSVKSIFTLKVEELLGPARKKNEELTQHYKDIAHSAQAVYEQAFFNILNKMYENFKLDSIAIAGGCGFNSVANGKVLKNTPFKKLYVQAAAGDAGGSIGAAFTTWHKFGGKKAKKKSPTHDHAYWGPSFSDEYCRILLEKENKKIEKESCVVTHVPILSDLINKTASNIANGKVVGWFQGSMEWGPRALGNRSIIGDPRRRDMKDILNIKIKRRESFRPFAPSIIHEKVSEWFEQNEDVPFMMQVYQIIEKKRFEIPAVTHVDGSGRLQTVYKHTNPRFHALIEQFDKITGVPIVLNTSFNENEPVVCKPEEALETFIRTKMDVLVIENWIIERI